MNVLSFRDEFTEADMQHWAPLRPATFPPSRLLGFAWSAQLRKAVLEADTDLLHLHGIWMYTACAALSWQHHTRRPLVISPRGMLDPWALDNSRWRKKVVGWFYADENLRSAACIHALCESEYRSIRAYGLKNPVCVIPNGIDLPDENSHVHKEWLTDLTGGRRIMLFLGRIHPKKGLENLVRAWCRLTAAKGINDEWVLAIAGWSQGGHEEELKALVQELGCQSSTLFLGPLYGAQKQAALSAAAAFILPSFSEGVPMSVLEAWSYGLPVVMTAECNIPQGFQAGAAVEIRPDVVSIKQGLESFLSLSRIEQRSMALNGRRLVETQFAWPQIARQMMDVYEWCLKQGPQPTCVRLD